MDTFAALALASIPPGESVMKEKPRKSTDFIITKSMRYYILGMGFAFLVLLMGMLFWFNSEEGGDDYLSVDCVLHVLCYASVLELVQCTCVRHFGLGVQGHF
ncbi:cation-translocating P-type ATPase C-terminal domain-containing protein [Bacteroides uniformis]|nr:cation-translocating P-type ATPase C-terminal domain-containing protein [Bacteroides uniformis]